MAKKFGYIILLWFFIGFAYMMLAAAYPAIQTLVADSSAWIGANTTATDFPGAKAAIDLALVWLWFIPGLVGIITSVIVLKRRDPS